jgi:hypothetical protein
VGTVSEQHRAELLAYLQGDHDPLDGAAVVGFALVVEMIMPDGGRGVVKITSDANGCELPWYESHKFAAVLSSDIDEFDGEKVDDEEDYP